MIKIELDPTVFKNLVALVVEGSKAKDTGMNGVIAGAQVLQILAQAEQAAQAAPEPQPPKTNGSGQEEARA